METKGIILLAGYEAFGDFKVNPSIAACLRRDGKTISGNRILFEEIPMRFKKVRGIIERHIDN